jgi:hypothetical protein
MTWNILVTREQSSIGAGAWTEYLCARTVEDGFLLGICIYELLGDIPSEWRDDDGELLPEYQDGNGDLLLPAQYEGRRVEGYDGEYILGPLDRWNNDESALVKHLSRDSVSKSLHELEWDTDDTDEVLTALHLLG